MTAPERLEPYLAARGVSKSFRGTVVLEELDLDIGRGEFVSLLGPSGCGKTTLLRLVAGLLTADRGTITLGGRTISGLPPHRRNVGVVFQNYALFPHLDVRENVAFGLRARGVGESEIEGTVRQFLDLVKLGDFARRYPAALSGGQQQRVAVARALATRPDILLLDEPFSALDRKLREGMQIELRHLLRELGITAVFVTHDQEEALVMSDRIAVMHQGRIDQFDTPEAVYGRPASRFVLDFLGSSAHVAGRVAGTNGADILIETAYGRIGATASFARGTRVIAAVRPEDIVLKKRAGASADRNSVPVQLVDRIYVGARTIAHLETPAGERLTAELAPAMAEKLATGDELIAEWPTAMTMVFPEEG